MLVLLGVLAACTPEQRLPKAEIRPPPSGTIRLAYPDWPATLNPVTEASPGARDILRPVLPSFYVVTPDLEYRLSLLAEEPRVEVEGERMVVSFRIRDDAAWSDGTSITVRDVAFTVAVMQDPEIGSVDAEGFERVVDVVEDAADRGRLVLAPPLPSWRDLFSAGRFVLPAHAAESPPDVATWDGGPPVSGGPFRIAEVIEGRSVILERTPRYWGSSARSRRIEVLAVPDPTTAIQLLQDGRVDVVAPTLGVSWGHRLGLLPGVRWGGAFGSDLVALVANVDRLPDGSTRHAVFEAVDRSRFTEAVIRDEGRPTDAVLPPGMEDAIPAWRSFGRGPVPPFVDEELQLVYARTELLELTARYIQAEVERAGGDLELVGLESDVFWSGFMAERRFDLALVEVRGSPTPDLAVWTGPPDGIWSSLSGLPAPPEQSLEETQRDLAFAAPVLPLFELRTTMGWRDGIEGVAPNPSVEGPLWNAQEWSKPEV